MSERISFFFSNFVVVFLQKLQHNYTQKVYTKVLFSDIVNISETKKKDKTCKFSKEDKLDSCNIRGFISKEDKQFIIKPVSSTDIYLLNSFVESSEKKCITATFRNSRRTKSFDQVKTVWALISIIFVSLNKRYPSELEKKLLYNHLVSLYAEKEILYYNGENIEVTVTLSEMSKRQASMFILALIKVLSDCDQVDYESKISIQEIFTEWQAFRGTLEEDFCDYDNNGNLLSVEEWRKLYSVSFASGLGGPLEIAHIVSKGSEDKYRDCVWNMILLTHEEHIEQQHRFGWDYFLELYPHLRGRVNRARKIAHKIELMERKDDSNNT